MHNQKEAVKTAFYAFLDDYFTRRDFEATMQHFGEHISGFGSSKDENTCSYEACYEAFNRDLTEAPDPIHYDIRSLKITNPVHNVGLASCELNISTTIREQRIAFNNLRYTLVFIKDEDRWRIEHKHLSLPSMENEDDEPYPIKELEERNEALKRMVDEKTEELNHSLERISELANNDFLTGISNRLKIDKTLKSLIRRAEDEGKTFSVILLDIDDFKQVNDTFGHLTGDNLLKATAELLDGHCDEDSIVGRWGGDEFIIITPGKTLMDAASMAESIQDDYRRKIREKGYDLTVSLGVCEYRSGDDIESIIMRGDKAVYKAKESGKDQLRICEKA